MVQRGLVQCFGFKKLGESDDFGVLLIKVGGFMLCLY